MVRYGRVGVRGGGGTRGGWLFFFTCSGAHAAMTVAMATTRRSVRVFSVRADGGAEGNAAHARGESRNDDGPSCDRGDRGRVGVKDRWHSWIPTPFDRLYIPLNRLFRSRSPT